MISKEFEQAVCKAFEDYEYGLKAARAEMETDSRGGAITALQTVILFTNAIPKWESQSLSLPLTALLSALNDLNSGRVVPMLEPKKGVDNRKPEPGFRKVRRAAAIFCIEKLVETGATVEEACKFVAAIIAKAGMPMEGKLGTPPWKTLKGWRYALPSPSLPPTRLDGTPRINSPMRLQRFALSLRSERVLRSAK